MQIHYTKHHNTYVTNLNVAMEKLGEAQQKNDVSAIIGLQSAIKFNGSHPSHSPLIALYSLGGGHLNHSIFWKNLAPVGQGGGDMPDGELHNMIKAQYGSLETFQKTMSAATVAVQGSGWGWLGTS
jgi:superoxide dismutase, Fe-Mn family